MLRVLRTLAFALVSTGLCNLAIAEMVANPVYDAWKKAGQGVCVISVTKSEAMGTVSESNVRTTLVELTEERATLQVQMSASVGGQKMELPATRVEIPAKVDDSTKDYQAADPKAAITEEKVTVPAGTFNCKVHVFESESAGTKSTSKVYISDEVPGGVVKSEVTSEGAMPSKTVTELRSIEKP